MKSSIKWLQKPYPIVLVGPTATGKTVAAIALAQRISGEIINADSMQVYKSMEIGTAKPTHSERAKVPFHLLDLVTPETPFSVSEWKIRAEAAIWDIGKRGKIPIICGGTGMYVRALLEDWSMAETPKQTEVRERLNREVEEFGATELHKRLQEIDPKTANRLHPNDAIRIIRALEVYETTGKPISEHQAEDEAHSKSRKAIKFGLTMPRPELYKRIEQRVDTMIENGWEAEVRQLLQRGYSPELSPLKSLGYKEMIAYVSGEYDHNTAVALIKQNTRRFAKRQQTWFRADPQIQWFDVLSLDSEEVAESLFLQWKILQNEKETAENTALSSADIM